MSPIVVLALIVVLVLTLLVYSAAARVKSKHARLAFSFGVALVMSAVLTILVVNFGYSPPRQV